MADIFEIVGRVSLEGIDKAEKALNNFTDAGQQSSSKLGKLGSFVKGVGKGILTIGSAVTTGSVALVKGVQSSYGELQQNLGGSEAVFGEYAKEIQKIGEEAYKNMGMSQSEFLATANKMGSLLQGSGISQRESLDLTSKAMQRASDVASVMGIDMTTAMESITGACKGNFTMMDNLGVAMNATTLEAYALEKGMTDFSWKTASQMEKNTLAMQMFLERTEQYAGNFARESTETITGAMGNLSSAWQDFMAGLGNPEADMARLTNNLAQSFSGMIKNIIPIIENIAKALPVVMETLINAVNELAPTLIETFTTLITQVINALVQMLPTIIPLVVDTLKAVIEALVNNLPLIIDAVILLVKEVINTLSGMLPTLIPLVVQTVVDVANSLINNLPMLLTAVLNLVMGVAQGIIDSVPILLEALPTVITSIVDFIVQSLPVIIDVCIQLFMALVEAIPVIIVELYKVLPDIITAIIDGLIQAYPLILDACIQLLMALIEAIPVIIVELGKALPDLINAIVTGLGQILGKFGEFYVEAIKSLGKFFLTLFESIGKFFIDLGKDIWDFIVDTGKTLGELGKKALDAGANLVKGLWNGISNSAKWLWNQITGWLNNIWKGILGFFGIKSPSRQMAWVGQMLVDGMAGSIDDNGEKAVKSAEQMATDILNAVDGITSEMPSINVGTNVANVVAESPLQKYQLDFNAQISALNDGFDRLIGLVGEYLPGISENVNRPIAIDGNSLAIGMSRKIDNQLGRMAVAKGRGNV